MQQYLQQRLHSFRKTLLCQSGLQVFSSQHCGACDSFVHSTDCNKYGCLSPRTTMNWKLKNVCHDPTNRSLPSYDWTLNKSWGKFNVKLDDCGDIFMKIWTYVSWDEVANELQSISLDILFKETLLSATIFAARLHSFRNTLSCQSGIIKSTL